MSVIYILWLTALKKYLRSRAQIVASLGSPLMYLMVLGFGLGPVFQRAGEGKYLQFIAPGVIGMKEMQGFQMVMNFLVMPIFLLSGAVYPLEGLPWVLAALTRVDPLIYGVDGVRGLLTGRTHFGVPLDIGVLVGVGVLFVMFGAWRFSKIEV